MAAPDSRPPRGQSLHEGIEELESLLKDRPAQAGSQIPVLDELADTAATAGEASVNNALAGIDPRQLAAIARHLEERLDLELADLAGVIRGVVKRCILDELRSFLPKSEPRSPGGAGTGTSEGPQDRD